MIGREVYQENQWGDRSRELFDERDVSIDAHEDSERDMEV